MAQSLTPQDVLGTTSTVFPRSHERITNPKDTPYFIDNEFRLSSARETIDVHDPATNNLVTRVPQMTRDELTEAVASAQRAFPAWQRTSAIARQQIMFRYVGLIRENWDRLAASITLEQGKTLADAKGDVLRGLQVAEAACAGPEYMKGEVLEVAKDMETRTYREALGVVAAICPFSKYITPFWFFSFFFGYELSNCRLPRYDSVVVHPHRYYYRQHACTETVRAGPRRRHDPRGTSGAGGLPQGRDQRRARNSRHGELFIRCARDQGDQLRRQ